MQQCCYKYTHLVGGDLFFGSSTDTGTNSDVYSLAIIIRTNYSNSLQAIWPVKTSNHSHHLANNITYNVRATDKTIHVNNMA